MDIPSERITWQDVYTEAELYRAAIRLYTPSLFSWRKALGYSTDQKNLYDFARHGLPKIDKIHKDLKNRHFRFRPGRALVFNFNGRIRTIYIYPWEERLVDVLLYRLLNRRLNHYFSKHSYAYRLHGLGIDICQKKIAATLRAAPPPLFISKRDVSDYFNSIDHKMLLGKLEALIEPGDYLFSLLRQRVEFTYEKDGQLFTAFRGIPFGTAVACYFANLYLTGLDRQLESIPGLFYYRYSDDILMFSPDKNAVGKAVGKFQDYLYNHQLADKENQRQDLLFSIKGVSTPDFKAANKFKHLGLEFRANGLTGLSRDKSRKICNLFRYALRRKRGSLGRITDTDKKIKAAINIIQKTLDEGVRNVAIIDYYLKHVNDESQLRLLDRWLAEEVLAVVFDRGHKRSNFRQVSFAQLRQLGLPSLVHRRRLIIHRHLESPFFRWRKYKIAKAYKGTVAKPLSP